MDCAVAKTQWSAKALSLWRTIFGDPGRPRSGLVFLLGCSLFGAGRNLSDRLQDLRSDLVGVALRVRAAVFQIALVAVVGEGMRHADRSAAVGNAVGEV